MHAATSGEVSAHIDAPPGVVYELISDVTRMGEWSPETTSCAWIGGATGPAVGARFRGRNRRGVMRFSNKPEVIVADPGQEFAFRRDTVGSTVIWRYRLEAAGVGTDIVESYETVKPMNPMVQWVVLKVMGIEDRNADLHAAMAVTLERLGAAARQAPPG